MAPRLIAVKCLGNPQTFDIFNINNPSQFGIILGIRFSESFKAFDRNVGAMNI